MRYAVGILGGVLLVTGCAVTRPPLPEANYLKTAVAWLGSTRCVQLDAMDASTAALAHQLIQEELKEWTVDRPRLKAAIYNIEQASRETPPTRDWCATIAVNAHTQAKQREENMAYARQVREEQANLIRSTTPRNTYCNHIGNQTFCNSF